MDDMVVTEAPSMYTFYLLCIIGARVLLGWPKVGAEESQFPEATAHPKNESLGTWKHVIFSLRSFASGMEVLDPS